MGFRHSIVILNWDTFDVLGLIGAAAYALLLRHNLPLFIVGMCILVFLVILGSFVVARGDVLYIVNDWRVSKIHRSTIKCVEARIARPSSLSSEEVKSRPLRSRFTRDHAAWILVLDLSTSSSIPVLAATPSTGTTSMRKRRALKWEGKLRNWVASGG